MSSFDEDSVVPGEEELMVPLDPPVISAPDKIIEPEPPQENQNLGSFQKIVAY